MSAPPFFQSAGRGELKFWGEEDEPTVVVWESLSESEQEQWLEKMGKSKSFPRKNAERSKIVRTRLNR